MGRMIQALSMSEEDYAGTGSGTPCSHPTDHPQKGNNDLLSLTQPDAIEKIHFDFAMAGADIVETTRSHPPPSRRPVTGLRPLCMI